MRKIIPVIAAGATGLLIASGAFAYATVDKSVSLSVDGQQTNERTFAGTVGDFLAAEGIQVSDKDVVAPGLDASLSEGSRVTVMFAREVTVTVDGEEKTFWTTATNVQSALAGLGIKLDGADLSTSRSASIGRDGIALQVATEKEVVLTNAGKKQTVSTTGQTVADVLKAAKVKADRDDKVTPSAKTKITDGVKVAYVRVDVKTVTEKSTIEHETRRTESDSLLRGVERVQTEGRDGELSTKFTLTYENGKLVKKAKGKSTTTREPVTEVVLVGTREPEPEPEPQPQPEPRQKSESDDDDSSSSGGSDSSSPAVPSGSVWDRLAQCESGGNWSINTGNGYYGGLQFSLSTWRGYGGTGMPHEQSREAQIAIATKVQASQGWGAWPSCSAKLGLR